MIADNVISIYLSLQYHYLKVLDNCVGLNFILNIWSLHFQYISKQDILFNIDIRSLHVLGKLALNECLFSSNFIKSIHFFEKGPPSYCFDGSYALFKSMKDLQLVSFYTGCSSSEALHLEVESEYFCPN